MKNEGRERKRQEDDDKINAVTFYRLRMLNLPVAITYGKKNKERKEVCCYT